MGEAARRRPGRTPLEIRDEIARWTNFICARRHEIAADIEPESASIEAAAASIIVGALTWVLGETSSTTQRVKV